MEFPAQSMEMLLYIDKKMKNYIVLLFCCVLLNGFTQQDIQSSNWFRSNVLMNPATAATDGFDYGFYTNCRLNYLTLGGIPLRTNSFATEIKIPDQKGKDNHFGIGIIAYNHQTGSNNFMTTSACIPVSYNMQIDRNNNFSVGLQPGIYMQGFSSERQTWESQWNGSNFTPDGSGENLNNSYMALDISGGMYYQLEYDGSYFGMGFSAKHLTRHKIDFSFGGDRIFPLYTLHFSGDIETPRPNLRINPNILFQKSGPNTSLVLGSSVENLLEEGSRFTKLRDSKSLTYGVYYRWNDAIIAMIGLNISGFQLGLSFDATVSKFSTANSSIGAVELYLKSQFYSKTKKKTRIKTLK